MKNITELFKCGKCDDGIVKRTLKETKTVFVNDCAADGCYKKNLGKGKQMCKEHQEMYEEGRPFKAFYGKTVKKKEFETKR